MAGRSVRFALFRVGLAIAVTLAGCTSPPATTPTPIPPAVAITIDGVAYQLEPGTTLGDAQRAFRLKPVAGRLLSVFGAVLERREQPGQLLLNASSPIGAPRSRAETPSSSWTGKIGSRTRGRSRRSSRDGDRPTRSSPSAPGR